MAALPPVPGPNTEGPMFFDFLGLRDYKIYGQLVNCTSSKINILTYNQTDAAAITGLLPSIPAMRFVDLPFNNAANCSAMSRKNGGFFMWVRINEGKQLFVVEEATRHFVVQVRSPRAHQPSHRPPF